MKKRILSWLLCVIMLISSVPAIGVSAAYSMIFPVKNGRLAYYYGYTASYGGNHTGIDIHSTGDDRIFAAAAGKVVATANSCPHISIYPTQCEHYNTFGNYIKIQHSDGTFAYYGHLKLNSLAVSVGQQVAKGTHIADMGSSGYSSGKHLHFEMRQSDGRTTINVNPTSDGGAIAYEYSGYPGDVPIPTTFAEIDKGTYYFKHNESGNYMNISWGTDVNEQSIHAHPFGGYTSQQYELSGSDSYALRPLCSDSRVVNGYGDNISSGKKVCLWDNTGHSSQRWKFQKVNGGYVIHNAQNTSCVIGTDENGYLYLYNYTGGSNQIWSIQNSIEYNANGGTGAPGRQMKNYGEMATISATKPTRSGYTFLGWSTSASATSPSYSAGRAYTANTNTVLYAVWKKNCAHNVYNVTTTKASFTAAGSIKEVCQSCGYTKATTIPKITVAKLSNTEYGYNGTVWTPTVTLKDSAGKLLKKGTDYTVSYPANRGNAGTHKVTIKMKGNYSGTKVLTFKVNPQNVSKMKVAKLSNTEYGYNGTVWTPTVTLKDSTGKLLKKGTDYTVSYPANRGNAGTHKVTIKMKGNYSGTKVLTFKVNPQNVSKMKVAKLSNTEYGYNGTVWTPTVTLKNATGKLLKKDVDYTVSYPANRKNAGTHKVTIKMKGNYSGTKVLTFKVNPVNVSRCKVSFKKATTTYNGKVKTPAVIVKNHNGTTLKLGVHYKVVYPAGMKNVGTYKVKVVMLGNYSGTKTLTYTIKKK